MNAVVSNQNKCCARVIHTVSEPTQFEAVQGHASKCVYAHRLSVTTAMTAWLFVHHNICCSAAADLVAEHMPSYIHTNFPTLFVPLLQYACCSIHCAHL